MREKRNDWCMYMAFTQKRLGAMLIGVSLLLILLLTWVKLDLDEQGVFLCEAVAADPVLEMEDCPVHKSNTSLLLIGAFSIAVLILGSGVYLSFLGGTISTPRPAVDLSKLDPQERQIYALLKESQGSGYQSDLIKATGFSKVQMTRLLDRMEGKQIIGRQRRGMTNIIVLR